MRKTRIEFKYLCFINIYCKLLQLKLHFSLKVFILNCKINTREILNTREQYDNFSLQGFIYCILHKAKKRIEYASIKGGRAINILLKKP